MLRQSGFLHLGTRSSSKLQPEFPVQVILTGITLSFLNIGYTCYSLGTQNIR